MQLLELEPVRQAPANSSRHDLYGPIYKAFRAFMHDALTRLGRLDADDDVELSGTIRQVEALLQQLRHHVRHEKEFVHPALEIRRPGSSAPTAEDHVHHLEQIAELEQALQAIAAAPAPRRPALAMHAYRSLALLIAENLRHMHVEETENNVALWQLYGDAELIEIHRRLQRSVSPPVMREMLGWMIGSLPTSELAEVLAGVRADAPAQEFDALVAQARHELPPGRFQRLVQLLGLDA
ncbi:MAG TPA: hypothetical protein VM491_14385 [Burkholderiaceae bacterium]|nr:hypothetical protein [Burkholderiaceae bacterium]